MDNFSVRTPPLPMMRMLSNPDRETFGTRTPERGMDGGITTFAGIGHAQRAPDYRELFSATVTPTESVSTLNVFDTRPETTRQFDRGLQAKRDRLQASLSAFCNRIDDCILIKSRLATLSRKLDTTPWGGEAAKSYALDAHWRAEGTVAYVRGEHDTDDTAPAQMTPLQARLGLRRESGAWSAV